MFKVGDKVKVIKSEVKSSDCEVGKIGIITKIISGLDYPYIVEGIKFIWCDDELKLVQPKQFTKSDLKERWLVKTRDGREAFLFEDTLYFIKNGKFTNSTIELDDYKNDLTCKIKSYEEYDIIEIYKPHYEKVWTREEETKEMTIAEIEKELGYKIKIVKGE